VRRDDRPVVGEISPRNLAAELIAASGGPRPESEGFPLGRYAL